MTSPILFFVTSPTNLSLIYLILLAKFHYIKSPNFPLPYAISRYIYIYIYSLPSEMKVPLMHILYPRQTYLTQKAD